MADRAAAGPAPARGLRVLLVSGLAPGLGTTTLAYGLAGVLGCDCSVRLIDLDGAQSAGRLGLPVAAAEIHGVACRVPAPPPDWRMTVLWPERREDLPRLLAALGAEAPSGERPVAVVTGLTDAERRRALGLVLDVVYLRAADQPPPGPHPP
jgi:hypothetical protein